MRDSPQIVYAAVLHANVDGIFVYHITLAPATTTWTSSSWRMNVLTIGILSLEWENLDCIDMSVFGGMGGNGEGGSASGSRQQNSSLLSRAHLSANMMRSSRFYFNSIPAIMWMWLIQYEIFLNAVPSGGIGISHIKSKTCSEASGCYQCIERYHFGVLLLHLVWEVFLPKICSRRDWWCLMRSLLTRFGSAGCGRDTFIEVPDWIRL